MKIGIDLVFIPDFQKRFDNIDPKTVFHEVELSQNPKVESLAGIFAVKEAFFKALGRNGNMQSIWIEKKETGQPILQSTLLKKSQAVQISISHDGEYATAIVIIYEK